MLGRSAAEGVMGNDREMTAILYLNPPDWDAQRCVSGLLWGVGLRLWGGVVGCVSILRVSANRPES